MYEKTILVDKVHETEKAFKKVSKLIIFHDFLTKVFGLKYRRLDFRHPVTRLSGDIKSVNQICSILC